MTDLLTASGAPIAPDKVAMHIAMTAFTGRNAVDRCIRAHGMEPSDDRVEAGRQHVEAHGGEVTEQGGIRWVHPQRPSLSHLLPVR